MNDAPLVSVIMNCFNSDRYLRDAIQSVIDQTYRNWEIIFWDNRSTDQSARIAISFHDSRIRYFLADEHTGLGKARNAALAKCTGEYVSFLDCDDIWFSDKLMKQVQLFTSAPDVGFVYGNYYNFDMKGNRRSLNFKARQPEGMIFGHLLHDFRIGLSTVMVRKSALEMQGSFFDTSLHLTEDYELFMRIVYASPAAYIQDPLTLYRIHPQMNSQTRKDKWVEELKYCNEIFRTLDKENRYSKDILHRENHITAIEAALAMVQGQLRKGRALISPHKFNKIAYFAMYMATFLPVSVWFYLQPLWRRFRPTIS